MCCIAYELINLSVPQICEGCVLCRIKTAYKRMAASDDDDDISSIVAVKKTPRWMSPPSWEAAPYDSPESPPPSEATPY